MVNERVGALAAEIGEVLAGQVGHLGKPALLYAELEPSVISLSVYVDEGNRILYQYPSRDFSAIIFDLWYEEPSKKRWSAIAYCLKGDKFEVRFNYKRLDFIGFDDRREDVVKEWFGEKPIHYE